MHALIEILGFFFLLMGKQVSLVININVYEGNNLK